MRTLHNLRRGFRLVWASARILFNTSDEKALFLLGDTLAEMEPFRVLVESLKREPSLERQIATRAPLLAPDLDVLHDLPERTLGHAYAKHFSENKIQPYKRLALTSPTEAEYVRERIREVHDFVHVHLGRGVSVLDEIAVLGYVVAQVPSPTSTLLALGALARTLFVAPRDLPQALALFTEYHQRGRAETNFLLVPWEDLLHEELPMNLQRDGSLA